MIVCEWCGQLIPKRVKSLHIAEKKYRAGLHVHHVDYARVGGNERFGDLAVLCADCHIETHRRVNRLVAKGFSASHVLRRFRPAFARKLLKVHQTWEAMKNG